MQRGIHSLQGGVLSRRPVRTARAVAKANFLEVDELSEPIQLMIAFDFCKFARGAAPSLSLPSCRPGRRLLATGAPLGNTLQFRHLRPECVVEPPVDKVVDRVDYQWDAAEADDGRCELPEHHVGAEHRLMEDCLGGINYSVDDEARHRHAGEPLPDEAVRSLDLGGAGTPGLFGPVVLVAAVGQHVANRADVRQSHEACREQMLSVEKVACAVLSQDLETVGWA